MDRSEFRAVALNVARRPFPPPPKPWRITMRWHDLVFCHWRLPAAELQARLPAGLALDTFEGSAWLTAVHFGMTDVKLRGGLGFPGSTRLREVNLRTYVKADRPGIWFWTIDAESRPIVEILRRTFHLPYLKATFGGASPSVEMERTDGRALAARYKVEVAVLAESGEAGAVSPPNSLDEFLHERYALISRDGHGRLWRGEVHHEPYRLSQAKVTIVDDGLLDGWSARGRAPDRVKYCKGFPVVAWTLEPVEGKPASRAQVA